MHGWGLPPWMDPDERPTWCYLEVDDDDATMAVDPVEVLAIAPALELVAPVLLDDIPAPAGVDWSAIRAHATTLGFPTVAHQLDELAAARRRRRHTGKRHKHRRRRYHRKGA